VLCWNGKDYEPGKKKVFLTDLYFFKLTHYKLIERLDVFGKMP